MKGSQAALLNYKGSLIVHNGSGRPATPRKLTLSPLGGAAPKAEFEGSTQANSFRAQKIKQLAQNRETGLAKKAMTLVHRAALQALLNQELEQYLRQLNSQGLTIQRTYT